MCSLDNAAPVSCTSPFTTSKLKKGKHTFAVIALNTAGNKSAHGDPQLQGQEEEEEAALAARDAYDV